MRRHPKIWWMGAVGVGLATLAGLSAARSQETKTRARAEGGGQEGKATRADARTTQLLIAHALDMAIEGSQLQLTIREAGAPGGQPGAVPRPGAAGQPAAAGAGAMGQGNLVQLQQQARRTFQDSYELMKSGNRMLRDGGEGQAPASRLYAASNLYANSLYAFARETFGWEVGWQPTGGGNDERARPGQDQVRPGGAGTRISTADLATVTLINHGVKESLAAFELHHALRDKGDDDAAAQQLRQHARSMATKSRQTIDQVVASLRERGGNAEGAAGAAGRPAGVGAPPAAAGGQAGWSGSNMQALAQQAREVVRVLDELGGEGGASGARTGR
jgi:hypothetical protein